MTKAILPVPARSALLSRVDVCRTVTVERKVYVCAEDLLDVFGQEAEAWKIVQYLEGLRPRVCKAVATETPTLLGTPQNVDKRWTLWSVVTRKKRGQRGSDSSHPQGSTQVTATAIHQAIASLYRTAGRGDAGGVRESLPAEAPVRGRKGKDRTRRQRRG